MLQIVARSVAERVATPSPKNSKIAPTPPRTPKRRSSSRITSFASTQSESAPSRRTPTISGAAVTKRMPRHRDRHLEPAGADRERADRAGRGRVRVRAEKQRARSREPLEVHVVRDPVAGARVLQPVARGELAQVAVRLHVPRVELEHVVVDVHHGERDGAAVDAERLELHRAHRPGHVLDQDLVDGQLELLARPADEMGVEQLAHERARRAILGAQWTVRSRTRRGASRSGRRSRARRAGSRRSRSTARTRCSPRRRR